MDSIRYSTQDIDENDIQSVVELLKSDFLTQGPVGAEFEQAVASFCGSEYAISVSSATAGLHIAYKALGLGPGDMVWTTPLTFVATANAALYCGAMVDFVDTDPLTFNMCPDALSAKLEQADKAGELPKIVAPVHLGGQSCDMKRVRELSEKYGFRIVEDASHAFGADYEGQKLGNCSYSDLCIFSLHPVKMITTGEGGLVLTQDGELARKCQLLRSHGVTRNNDEMESAQDGRPWYYEQVLLGFNYRLSDIQAALGLTQLSRLTKFVEKRRSIALTYDQNLNRDLYVPQSQISSSVSSYHLYLVKVRDADLRDDLFSHLKKRQIMANLHYIPIYRHPYFQRLCPTNPSNFPNSEDYYARALSIPVHTKMSESDKDRVLEAMNDFTVA